jgi:hypothetical protein
MTAFLHSHSHFSFFLLKTIGPVAGPSVGQKPLEKCAVRTIRSYAALPPPPLLLWPVFLQSWRRLDGERGTMAAEPPLMLMMPGYQQLSCCCFRKSRTWRKGRGNCGPKSRREGGGRSWNLLFIDDKEKERKKESKLLFKFSRR